MGSRDAGCTNTIKVHSLMCSELEKFVDRISQIYSDIEASRPRCAAGLNALCQLHLAMDKAKLLIEHCSESSKLHLAITGEKILKRCIQIQNDLGSWLDKIQNMVPTMLAAKISGIVEDLRNVEFHLESTEDEAGKVILALLRQDIPGSSDVNDSELLALRIAAKRLKIKGHVDILVEKRCIKTVLNKQFNPGTRKAKVLKYLLFLLRKYGELIWKGQIEGNPSYDRECNCQSTPKPQLFGAWDKTRGDGSGSGALEPPEELKCPMSMRLMYDPVVIASGKTYERFWIEKWFNDGHNTCPMTHMRLDNSSLTPNVSMRRIISKWCSEHGVTVSAPHLQSRPPAVSLQKNTSARTVASFASSIDDLRLQHSGISFQSSSSSGSPYSLDKDDNDVRLAFLSELTSLPWASKCKAVQDVNEQLKNMEKACDLIFPSNYLRPLVKFLKDAHNQCDVKAQKDSAEMLLAILRKIRTAISPMDADAIFVFASLIGSEITGEALAIMEILSSQKDYTPLILASGILNSILTVVGTEIREFHEVAMKILSNLSWNIDLAYHIIYLDCTSKLIPFLGDCKLASYCLNVISNLCNIEEGRIAVAESEGCVRSIKKFLKTGTKVEQETAVGVILSLCYESADYCQLVMGESTFYTLFDIISMDGNSRAKVISVELVQLLTHLKADGKFSSCASSSINSGNKSGNDTKGQKSPPSTAFGYLRKKISTFFHHSH